MNMYDVISAGVDTLQAVHNTVGAVVPTAVTGEASGASWNWAWTPPAELQNITRKIAFFLGIIWVVYVISQFVVPGKRGGGRNVKIGGILMVLFAIVVLCNLTILPAIVNVAGRLVYLMGQAFGWW